MKTFEQMTEAEIVADALKAVPDYLATIRATGEFRLQDCMKWELDRIKRLFRASRGPLGRRDIDEMDLVLAHFETLLPDATRPRMQRYLRGRRISDIYATRARNLITGLFADAGLEAGVTGQRYRARVETALSPDTLLRFYVRYRDLADKEAMNGTLKAVLDLRDALGRLGSGTALSQKKK